MCTIGFHAKLPQFQRRKAAVPQNGGGRPIYPERVVYVGHHLMRPKVAYVLVSERFLRLIVQDPLVLPR